jgi:hypothetical protein
MDPITIGLAFTAAEAAVSGIKRAIALGKDIHEITGDLSSFFKHTAEVKIAAAEAQRQADDPTSTQDVTMMAMDIVLKEKKLRDDEAALKNMIIYELDQAAVWFDMERVRENILQKQRRADEAKIKAHTEMILEQKRLARVKQRKREQFWYNVQVVLGLIISSIIVAGFCYALYWLFNEY